MDISLRDAVGTALWRFHDTAMEHATLIYTFTRSTYEDAPGLFDIYQRQLVRLIDLIHEFAFNARRAIERAEAHDPGIVKAATAYSVHYGMTDLTLSKFEEPSSLSLTQESLWWVLGRIIHSKQTHLLQKTVDVIITNPISGRHHSIFQPVAFQFASDRDTGSVTHCVHLQSLVEAYVRGFAHRIEGAVIKRNRPDVKTTDTI